MSNISVLATSCNCCWSNSSQSVKVKFVKGSIQTNLEYQAQNARKCFVVKPLGVTINAWKTAGDSSNMGMDPGDDWKFLAMLFGNIWRLCNPSCSARPNIITAWNFLVKKMSWFEKLFAKFENASLDNGILEYRPLLYLVLACTCLFRYLTGSNVAYLSRQHA